MSNVAYTVSQCISWLIYLTGFGSRKVAKLLPELYREPVFLKDEGQYITSQDEAGNTLFHVDFMGEEVPMQLFNLKEGERILEAMPSDPTKAIEELMVQFGEVFLVEEVPEKEYFYVSPLLALKLGDGGGSQLNLYTEVVYRFLQLLHSHRTSDDKVWEDEYKQWKGAHNAVLKAQMKGDGDENKAGLVAKATRGKGVYSFKCGAWIGRTKDIHGEWHTFEPGYLYLSTENPQSKLQGKTAFPWRNPMTLVSFLPIVTVGPKTMWCPKPTWETNQRILPDTKGYLHPMSISDKAGDVDGDGLQFGVVEALLNWAMNNWHIVCQYNGLPESIIHHFMDEV